MQGKLKQKQRIDYFDSKWSPVWLYGVWGRRNILPYTRSLQGNLRICHGNVREFSGKKWDHCVGTLTSIIELCHYNDVIMSKIASQITSLTIVYSTVYISGPDQTKHQSSASLAFVRGIHRRPVNSPHKWPVTRKMFPFDDVIMCQGSLCTCNMTYTVCK